MRIGIVFVAYNAPTSFIEKVVRKAQLWALPICVVDNSPQPDQALASLKQYGVEIRHQGNRGGIAAAFNVGITWLKTQGCTGYITFDQDSEIPDDFISDLLLFLKSCPQAQVVCPNFYDVNSRAFATFIVLRRWYFKVSNGPTTDLAISSGFYLSDQAWQTIGRFNEALIIDRVDTEYCLRAKQLGYTIWVNRKSVLKHAIGQRSRHKLLGLITIKPSHHSVLRRYYIARNATWLSLRYACTYPSFLWLSLIGLCLDT